MGSKPVQVAGIDLSWSGCLVTVRDVPSGDEVRAGQALLSDADDPASWWAAVQAAIMDAAGFADVSAFAITAPTALVALDEHGAVVHVDRAGSPIAAARRLRERDPALAARIAAVLQPHDWLTWRLRGFGPDAPNGPRLEELAGDRSDAAASGWWDARTARPDHAALTAALGHAAIKPRVMRPDGWGGEAAKLPDLGIRTGRVIGVGAHRLAAMMLGAGAQADEAVLLRCADGGCAGDWGECGDADVLCAVCDEAPETGDLDPAAAADGRELRWLPDATGRFLVSVPVTASPADAAAQLREAGAAAARIRTVDPAGLAARGMAAQAAWALTRTLPEWPAPAP